MPSGSLWLTKDSQFWHYAKYISTEATITQSCLQQCYVTLCRIWGLETIQNLKMHQYNLCKCGKELVFLGVPVTEGMVLGGDFRLAFLSALWSWATFSYENWCTTNLKEVDRHNWHKWNGVLCTFRGIILSHLIRCTFNLVFTNKKTEVYRFMWHI